LGQRLHRLVYHSRNSFPADLDAPAAILRSILATSRARNAIADVTGVLMLKDGWFGQVLEGPEDVVSTTFTRIKRDDRHRAVSLLAFEPIAERGFPQWPMGYVGPGSTAAVGDFDPSGVSATELFDLLQTLACEQQALAPGSDYAAGTRVSLPDFLSI
jgi:hypothetical protein